MATYEEKQKEPNSEKIVLAIAEASKRLVGWNLLSGSVYSLSNFDFAVIAAVEESGVAYIEVDSIGAVGAGTFFNDRRNKIIYTNTLGSVNPNGVFLTVTFKNFFANIPIILPNDLASGFEVEFLPTIRTTSKFGVEIDNSDQIGQAIESGGNIAFINDFDYWKSRYDKFIWDGNKITIYSLIDDLPGTEAKKIFDGTVKGKTYSTKDVRFILQDQLSELRANYPLTKLKNF